MSYISIDNGHTYLSASEAIPQIEGRNLWPTIAEFMDDEIREIVHRELASCTEKEFLARYLELAPNNLVIG